MAHLDFWSVRTGIQAPVQYSTNHNDVLLISVVTGSISKKLESECGRVLSNLETVSMH
jgi:hypothetical protein